MNKYTKDDLNYMIEHLNIKEKVILAKIITNPDIDITNINENLLQTINKTLMYIHIHNKFPDALTPSFWELPLRNEEKQTTENKKIQILNNKLINFSLMDRFDLFNCATDNSIEFDIIPPHYLDIILGIIIYIDIKKLPPDELRPSRWHLPEGYELLKTMSKKGNNFINN